MSKSVADSILIGESVYIVGHKKPDLDAIVSALCYQVYRHSKGDFNYVAIRCDEINPLTKWAFEESNMELPALVSNVAGKQIVLVDHTDPEQRPDGWEEAEIIEVLDHHKLKLETNYPPKITIRPYGSTTTLVAQKMLNHSTHISSNLAKLMLAAIFDDTLALRSPITTYIDRSVAGELSALAGINDLGAFAREIFSKKDVWSTMKPERIISTDSKIYDAGERTYRIVQVETMDNRQLESKEKDILRAMKEETKREGYSLFLVLLTDLLRNDCIMLVDGVEKESAEEIFGTKLQSGYRMHLPGVVSRKKQVVPLVNEYYTSLES